MKLYIDYDEYDDKTVVGGKLILDSVEEGQVLGHFFSTLKSEPNRLCRNVEVFLDTKTNQYILKPIEKK